MRSMLGLAVSQGGALLTLERNISRSAVRGAGKTQLLVL